MTGISKLDVARTALAHGRLSRKAPGDRTRVQGFKAATYLQLVAASTHMILTGTTTHATAHPPSHSRNRQATTTTIHRDLRLDRAVEAAPRFGEEDGATQARFTDLAGQGLRTPLVSR